MSILLNSIAITVALGNIIFNIIRMIQHKHEPLERDTCISRIKMFGYMGAFAAILQVVFSAIHKHYGVNWPNVVGVILAILVINVIVLGMVFEYEEIKDDTLKWTP